MASTTKSDPSIVQLVLQYLDENGYERTLKEFEAETGVSYDGDSMPMGGMLENIVNDHKELQLSANFASQNLNEDKKSIDKLFEKGDQDYVKSMKASLVGLHKNNILSVSFSYDKDQFLMASGSSDKTIKVFDFSEVINSSEKGKEVLPKILGEFTQHNGPVLSLDFNKVFKNLLGSCAMDGTVAITDISTGKVIAQFKKHEKYVVSVKWSHDGNVLASASHDHSLNIYQRKDADSPFEFVDKYDYPGNVEAIAFHKDGRLVVSVREDNYLKVIDLNSRKQTQFNMNANLDDHVSFTAMDLSWSPDFEYLLVSTDRDRLIMYRMESGSTPVRNFYGASNDIYSQPHSCWHPSGKYIYSTCQDHKIYCWEVSSQKIVAKLAGHNGLVRSLVQHPHLNLLGSASFDKTVRLWADN